MAQTATPQKLSLPGVGRGGWACDPAAIRDAIDLLGIVRPVEIKIVGAYRIGGTCKIGPSTHVITIATDSTPEKASRAIWHELTHAAQCESFDSPQAFARAYRTETLREGGGRVGYFNNRYEQEARSNESLSDDLRLTRPATR